MPAMHKPVMPDQVLEGWYAGQAGNYVDGTFGRGGHSDLMLRRLQDEGNLLAIDRDPEAVLSAGELCSRHSNFECVQASFNELDNLLEQRGWRGNVSGILLDLGVSSPQLDNASRGFSFMRDGPLDMRMDPGSGISAAQWLASASAGDIAGVLKRFGEERFAKRIAAGICEWRAQKPLQTTGELVKIIESAVPRREANKHSATRTFQALRIFINGELDQLAQFLGQCLAWLKPGGRLAVISFHSLEDRMVKRFMRDKATGDSLPSHLPVRDDQLNRELRIVVRGARAAEQEIAANPRARSAVLRVAEKIRR